MSQLCVCHGAIMQYLPHRWWRSLSQGAQAMLQLQLLLLGNTTMDILSMTKDVAACSECQLLKNHAGKSALTLTLQRALRKAFRPRETLIRWSLSLKA